MSQPHFAVAIGINDYPGFGPAAQLRVAKQDAARFAAWLRSNSLPQKQVRLLRSTPTTDTLTAIPTADLVDATLANFVADLEKAKADSPGLQGAKLLAGSRLYLFFSGHGVTTQNAELAMMMANATEGLAGLNVTAELYVDHFRRRGLFRRILVFADCCRTLSPQTRGRGPGLSDPGVTPDPVQGAIYYAAPYNTRAYEGSTHGHFTRALLEGLLGAAADPVSGRVTTRTVLDWLGVRLQQLSKGVQEAQWRGDNQNEELATVTGAVPGKEGEFLGDYLVAMNSYLGIADLPAADPDADIEDPVVQNALLDDLRKSVEEARASAIAQFQKATSDGNNPFLGGTAPKTCKFQLVFPPGFAGQAEVVDGSFAVVWSADVTAAAGVPQHALPAGFYEVRPASGTGFAPKLFALNQEDVGDVRLEAN